VYAVDRWANESAALFRLDTTTTKDAIPGATTAAIALNYVSPLFDGGSRRTYKDVQEIGVDCTEATGITAATIALYVNESAAAVASRAATITSTAARLKTARWNPTLQNNVKTWQVAVQCSATAAVEIVGLTLLVEEQGRVV